MQPRNDKHYLAFMVYCNNDILLHLAYEGGRHLTHREARCSIHGCYAVISFQMIKPMLDTLESQKIGYSLVLKPTHFMDYFDR